MPSLKGLACVSLFALAITASPALAQLATHHELGEIRDLQPEIVAALQALLRNGIWPNAKIAIPGWNHVGHVDVAVRDKDDEGAILLAAELKWGKPDEAVWDVFKMALLAMEPNVAATFLVGGIAKKQVEVGFCADSSRPALTGRTAAWAASASPSARAAKTRRWDSKTLARSRPSTSPISD